MNYVLLALTAQCWQVIHRPPPKVVTHSTGGELYNIMLRELRSVGAPTWMSAELEAPTKFTVFAFVLDQGPDNQWVVKFIRSLLSGRLRVAMMTVWCFLHQYHLIVKNVVAFLDAFRWTSPAAVDTAYFHGISSISNCWRMPGNPAKVYNKTCELFGDVAGASYAKKVPGRALRGRLPESTNLSHFSDLVARLGPWSP